MQGRNRTTWLPWLLLAIVLVGGWLAWPRQPTPSPTIATGDAAPAGEAAKPLALPPADAAPSRRDATGTAGLPGFLPTEAADTIAMIQRGGPFPHRQDGTVFGNREGRLPRQPRGWYHEYTVETPGLSHRGTRRIITGGDPPREWYYTDDHYDSFRRFDVPGGLQ